MTDTDVLKRDIRKRLFLSATRRGDGSTRHGFRWCKPCRGTGEVCNEYSDDSGCWAIFELCEQCGGEGVADAAQD